MLPLEPFLPCPYCGKTELTLERSIGIGPYPRDGWFVYCWKCSHHGPIGPAEVDARRKWNTRKLLPLVQALVDAVLAYVARGAGSGNLLIQSRVGELVTSVREFRGEE